MGITGGTANYLIKYTGVTSISSSQIFDNGTSVSIGTTGASAGYQVTIKESLRVSGTMSIGNVPFGATPSNYLTWNTSTEKVEWSNPPGAAIDTIILTAAGGLGSITSGATGPFRKEFSTNKQNMVYLDFAETSAGGKIYAEWGILLPNTVAWPGAWLAQIYWFTGTGSTGNVCWGMEYAPSDEFFDLDRTWTAASVDVLDSNSTTPNQLLISPPLSLGLTGSYTQIRAYRYTGTASDTLGYTASLLAIKLVNYAP
jgi:hypothetical protein